MNESATDVIVARSKDVDRLSTMLAWSVGAHIVIATAALLLPSGTSSAPPTDVMVISLGGAPGPKTQGLTQMGARAVQAPEPAQNTKRAETAPAPVQPKMTLPDPKAKVQPRARPENAPREATAKAPSTGAQPQEGTTRAETRVRGQGFGLSTGGGGGGGVTVEATNFCCPDYIITMKQLVETNWNQKQDVVGLTTMKFTIRRDGTIDDIQLEKSSGFVALDNEANRALRLTRLPSLPRQYPNPTLVVHLEFEYVRR